MYKFFSKELYIFFHMIKPFLCPKMLITTPTCSNYQNSPSRCLDPSKLISNIPKVTQIQFLSNLICNCSFLNMLNPFLWSNIQNLGPIFLPSNKTCIMNIYSYTHPNPLILESNTRFSHRRISFPRSNFENSRPILSQNMLCLY